MPFSSRSLGLTALVSIVALGACVRMATPSATQSNDARVTNGITQLRAATQPYQRLDAAVAAGYPRTVDDCIIDEMHGAMGYHHVNRGYVDAKLEIDKPEILLYQRMPDGAYKLNGVEFVLPFRFWPRDSVAPVLMGQTLHPEDNLKYWYLHVWAWTSNRDGLFANMNPDVTCPSGGKVYKASPPVP